MGIEVYQSRIVPMDHIVDYSAMVMEAYPMYAVRSEPFVGFKMLMFDQYGRKFQYGERLKAIESLLPFVLPGSGCIIREADPIETQGNVCFWIVTAPVPRSQIATQMKSMLRIVRFLSRYGVFQTGICEIAVSGHCLPTETDDVIGSLRIPENYRRHAVVQSNSPYVCGMITRINDEFICHRSRWYFDAKNLNEIENDMIILSQLISTIYRG